MPIFRWIFPKIMVKGQFFGALRAHKMLILLNFAQKSLSCNPPPWGIPKNIHPWLEVIEGVCKGFEDYAQAKYKASGEPTIIRLMTHEGNMNPLMSVVDMVPDEDLNTKLKFYVSI